MNKKEKGGRGGEKGGKQRKRKKLGKVREGEDLGKRKKEWKKRE